MRIIYNNYFPFGKFYAINICGLLFVKDKEGAEISARTINHESIHTAQMREMWYIGFYLWCFIEWLYQAVVRLFRKDMQAYYFITMEQEAHANDENLDYLKERKPFAWWKHIGEWKKY